MTAPPSPQMMPQDVARVEDPAVEIRVSGRPADDVPDPFCPVHRRRLLVAGCCDAFEAASGRIKIPDPWRVLAGMPDVGLLRLPIGDWGRYYHDPCGDGFRAIIIREGLSPCEERAVLWHELVHAAAGDRSLAGTPAEMARELAVQREAARLAMPWPVLRWGLDTATTWHELVALMLVDDGLVRTRLAYASSAERGYMKRQAEGTG